ncbi:MAG TPA: SDR family NAD(P)-dependent oxidoreductase [Opitutaceae bacterium]
MSSRAAFQFITVLKPDHPLVRDHRVYDVRILPGVTFLDLLYRVLPKKGLEPEAWEVSDILFHKPVALGTEFHQRVRLTVAPRATGWGVRGESCRVEAANGRAGEWEENMSCELRPLSSPAPVPALDVERLRAEARQVRDLDAAYAHARGAGIQHLDFMKGEGVLHLGDGWLLGELRLSAAARHQQAKFHLHPAHLDCATLVSVFPETRTFIPLHIERFRCGRRLGERCFAWVDRRAVAPATDDLCHSNLELFDEHGTWVATLAGLTAKRIRSKEAVLALSGNGANAEKGIGTAAPVVPPIEVVEHRRPPVANATSDLAGCLVPSLTARVARLRSCRPDQINADKGFYEQGLESTQLLKLVREIEEWLGVRLYPTLLFEYTTVSSLAGYLAEQYSVEARKYIALPATASETTVTAAAPAGTAGLIWARPCWRTEEPPAATPARGGAVLLLGEEARLGIAKAIRDGTVITARYGTAFARLAAHAFEVDPANEADFDRLLETLQTENLRPERVLSIGAGQADVTAPEAEELRVGLLPITHLYQACLRRRLLSTPLKLLHVFANRMEETRPLQAALSGFLRSAQLENPKLAGGILEIDAPDWKTAEAHLLGGAERLLSELEAVKEGGTHVRWQGGGRTVRRFEEFDMPAGGRARLRAGGAYLITGGASGVGYRIGEYLSRKYKARIVLCGRSEAALAEPALERLRPLGGEVIYVQADVTKSDDVRAVVARAREEFGALHGVIHAAGIVHDALLAEKTWASIAAVLAPKLAGARLLDEQTREDGLDFFALFSSVAALRGNIGQCDYAYANAFLDHFAAARERLWREGRRAGQSLSINWPFWAEGGMSVDAEVLRSFETRAGMIPLATVSGCDAFERALAGGQTQLALAAGDPARLRQWFGFVPDHTASEPVSARVQEAVVRSSSVAPSGSDEPIAVIGLAGRYPEARDLDEFWENLKSGRDSVGEIPAERWDHSQWYSPERGAAGRTYCKWGSFLTDIDKFDPLFFGITPREAEMMDPQERLFLETAWHTFEDAGYTREALSGEAVGVYVGVMWSQYQLWGWEQTLRGNVLTPNAFSASIANRVSYTFDLKGPSLALDTMCSSSLTALDLAGEALRRGTCSMALVGGVNLSLHPTKFLFLSRGNFASTDGRCRAFGEGGDGYVPGEGVGAVLLKPLSRAQADGDLIYGVIRATAVGHGGKTSGHAVPSPTGQAAVIKQALRRAAIDPRTITYIEAHGTGTSLGDPIEIAGLTQAFQGTGTAEPFCAIGSVKSNIGHLESSAGIAGLTKILLQLKHRELVPSLLHSERLNPHIDFGATPFRVQTKAQPWQPASVAFPLRAGLSSFGAGGTNAHVIVEEAPRPARPASPDGPQVFVLSARTADRLKESAEKLTTFLERREGDEARQREASLADIAFTLQTAREPMEERLAIVAGTAGELRDRLHAFVDGRPDDNVMRGAVGGVRPDIDVLLEGREGDVFLQILREDRKLAKLARLWVLGREIEWVALHRNGSVRRVSLPGYAFARERYWLGERPAPSSAPVVAAPPSRPASTAPLHPLVHRDISEAGEQRFLSQMRGDEFFLADHRLGDEKLLPGVAALEIAIAAGRLANQGRVRKLQQVAWLAPVMVNGTGVDLEVCVAAAEEGAEYRVTLPRSGTLHAQGRIVFGEPAVATAEAPSVAAMDAHLTGRLTGAEFYAKYPGGELRYGPAFRGIEEVRYNRLESLARIALPAHLKSGYSAFTLHPSLLDSALQAVIVLLEQNAGEAAGNFLPFALDELEFYADLPTRFLAHARLERLVDGCAVFSLTLFDDAGRALARLRNLTLKSAASVRGSETARSEATLYFEERWQPLGDAPLAPASAGPTLLLSNDSMLASALSARGRQVVRVVAAQEYAQQSAGLFAVRPGSIDDLETLLSALRQDRRLPGTIIQAWALEQKGGSLEEGLQLGLRTNFALAKALSRLGLAADRGVLFAFPQPTEGTVDATSLPAYAAMAGFARTVEAEFAELRWTTAALPRTDAAQARAEALGAALDRRQPGAELRLDEGRWLARRLVEVTPAQPSVTTFREGGVYLVTGGAAGLGYLFAEHLARLHHARLVLVGRSPHTPEKLERLAAIERLGGEAIYVQADIGAPGEAVRVVEEAKRRFGGLQGVLHSAGLIEDAGLFRKTAEQVERVIAPKVHGACFLDEATREVPLDCFVLFSSISALRGNRGQADYAFANRFLDVFAEQRERLRSAGRRSGRTVSINWPMWDAGGMTVGPEAKAALAAQYGLEPLPVAKGIAALEVGLSGGASNVLVVHGRADRLREWLLPAGNAHVDAAKAPAGTRPVRIRSAETTADRDLEAGVRRLLVDLVAAETRLPVDRIRTDKPLEDYGIDSVMILNVTRELQRSFGDLPKTLFFEYQTLDALSACLVREHAERVRQLFGPPAAGTEAAHLDALAAEATPTPETKTVHASESCEPGLPEDAIAIVGLAGRYPDARDVEEFWENLKAGRDSVKEVPPDRWDWRRWFDADKRQAGTMYTKWGGFLEGIEAFDAAFFNISPREAKLMDPQERLFLETAWQAFEDAGLTRSALSGRRVGVYAGAMYAHYQLFAEEARRAKIDLVPNSTFANISNRVSYWFNLRGPSLTLDTMCSSSLSAVHLACEALRAGQIEAALAGGVNLSLHPQKYLELSQGKFAATDGRCRSFGAGGDGYVPGEGVGAVVLKTLARARADGDRVHGVILASALNHGGKTNGYTVPNPVAQGELVAEALAQAKLSPDQLSYIEAHGTGTSLGDPVEINGLERAFRPATARRQFCAIGSAKSNIGHLEAAAGMAGLTKILLQFRHGAIAPSLHSREVNPHIDFAASPFHVPQQLTPWPAAAEARRYAGLSSFGAGGANAHLVLADVPVPERTMGRDGPELFVLSARTPERLRAYAAVVAEWLTSAASGKRPHLADLAFTSQAGREPMEHRLAVVVADQAELADRLVRFAAGEADARVTVGQARDDIQSVDTATVTSASGDDLAAQGKAWVAGAPIEWRARRIDGDRPGLVSFPSYPFARKRCWILPEKAAAAAPSVEAANPAAPSLQTAGLPADFLYVPVWREEPIAPTSLRPSLGSVLIVLPAGAVSLRRAVETVFGGASCMTWVLGESNRDVAERCQEIAARDPRGVPDALTRLRTPPERVIFLGALEHTAWDADDLAGLQDRMECGVLTLFRLVKALVAAGGMSRLAELTVLTDSTQAVHPGEAVQPAGASVRGFCKVLAREYPSIAIRSVDTDWRLWRRNLTEDALAGSLRTMLAEPPQRCGEDVAWRDGRRYVRGLAPVEVPPSAAEPWRNDGVHVILGGAGGLGLEFARDLALRVGAKVALIGRRELDPARARILTDITERGGRVNYYRADATRWDEMTAAVRRINEELGPIGGVIHSAIVLEDMRLDRMDEAVFRRVLDAKVAASAVLMKALKDQPLAHALFFSSAQALAGNEGQANYVAGCAFKDAFAQHLQHRGRFEVRTISWGYWGSVGVVATPEYRARLAAQGIGSIEANEGIETVRRVLAHGPVQVVPMKVDARVLAQLGLASETRCVQPPAELQPFWHEPALLAELVAGAGDAGAFREAIEALDRLARDLLVNALRTLGAFTSADPVTLDAWRKQMGVAPKYVRLLEAVQPLLASMGVLAPGAEGDAWAFVLREPADRMGDLDARGRDLAYRHPEIAAYVNLVAVCLREFPRILRGECLPQDVLFPRSGVSVLEGVYQRNRIADHYNGFVARAVQGFVGRVAARCAGKGSVKILEIGAGTGGTTALVLPALSEFESRIHYCYSDVSAAFLRHGRRAFAAAHGFMEFKRLDIEQPVEGQGFDAGGWDLVIATNVLHATGDIDVTLGHVRELLRPGGWLLLNELTLPRSFLTLTFGLLDGWWAHRDAHRRLPGSPLLDAASWEDALHRTGFGRTRRLTARADEGQDVLVAEAAAIFPASARRLAAPAEESLEHAAPVQTAPLSPAPMPARTDHVEHVIAASVRAVLQLDPGEELDRRAAFLDLGVDSILAVEIINRINDALRIQLRTTDIYNYATIAGLAAHAAELMTETNPEGPRPVAPTVIDAVDASNPEARDLDPLGLLTALSRGEIDEDEATQLLESV